MKKFFILVLLLLVTGCKYNEYNVPDEVNIVLNDNIFDVYKEFHENDLIKEANVELLNSNKLIKTNEIGEFSETISFLFNKKKYKKTITYKVIDSIKPVFINTPSVKTYLINSEKNPCDEIVFGDNYDKEPICYIEGFYNLKEIGAYNVKYVIKDNSGNINEKNLKINVVNTIITSKSTGTKNNILLNDVISSKKNDNTMIGIDVSRYQEHIDFQKVKDAGVEFVIMRMGINSDIDKDIYVDTYYKENIKNAKEAGLKVGIYVYSSAINDEIALEHAKWTINILDGEKLDFPIAYDWENWSKFRNYKISIYDLDHAFITFANTLKDAGYEAMLYSSKFYLENVWLSENDYPVWLAHYTNNTNYEGNYILWQMCNTGKVNGINGDVDIDIYYKK